MIENAGISIIIGGFYHCTPEWNHSRDVGKFVELFGFIIPVSGDASYETSEGEYRVSPGHVYFVPGPHLTRQVCEREMDIYWVNFASESYYLYHRLLTIKSVHGWPLAEMPAVEPVFRRFADYFGESVGRVPGRPLPDRPAGLALKIEGSVMSLTGHLIETTSPDFHWNDYSGLERLKPAIDFMDEHYLRNPPLIEIAALLKLAPPYFHSLFKRETGLTPFKYMENRRLDLARKLLFDQRLNITEVACEAGYDSLDYFSRAFRRRFGLSPSKLRQAP